MLRLGQKISSVRILILKGGSSLRGAFFSVSLGPGAAVSGMQIEINTGYSCYLTAARRRRGGFFLVGLSPGAEVSGMRIEINTAQLLYDM